MFNVNRAKIMPKILHAKNNCRAALYEKTPCDHRNEEDNVDVSTKVLAMRKRIQVLLLMITNVSYVVELTKININTLNM